MASFRERYGQGPLHLIAAIASLAVVAYALLEIAERPSPISFAVFFAGAIIAHDLISFPLYSLLGAIAGRAVEGRGEAGRLALNHVRVPAILSGFFLIAFFPFILGLAPEAFEGASGKSTDPYLGRWLLLSAAMFAISGVAFAVRLRRARGARS